MWPLAQPTRLGPLESSPVPDVLRSVAEHPLLFAGDYGRMLMGEMVGGFGDIVHMTGESET